MSEREWVEKEERKKKAKGIGDKERERREVRVALNGIGSSS